MNVTCFVSSHRFNFLLPCLPSSWIRATEQVPKTMLWDFPTIQAWWEIHDGVLDHQVESTERLELCLAKHDKKKKFMYVKPNLSETCSKNFFPLVESVGGSIVTCYPWSYYDAYQCILQDRVELRKQRKSTNIVSFLGSSRNIYAYDRERDLRAAMQTYGEKLNIKSGLNTAQYVQEVLKSKWMLQPHGIGPRHSIYEAMCLGTPSIVPISTYLKFEVMDCCVDYDPGFVPNNYALKQFDNDELSQHCIETWETYMHPSKIVADVLYKIENCA